MTDPIAHDMPYGWELDMVRDALRAYLSLASGLVEVPRQQALRAARALVGQGEATAGQVGGIAEDLIGTSRANREALVRLVRYEIDRGFGRVGLATADEVRELSDRIQQLEQSVRALHDEIAGQPAAAARASGATAPRKTTRKATSATSAGKPQKATKSKPRTTTRAAKSKDDA